MSNMKLGQPSKQAAPLNMLEWEQQSSISDKTQQLLQAMEDQLIADIKIAPTTSTSTTAKTTTKVPVTAASIISANEKRQAEAKILAQVVDVCFDVSAVKASSSNSGNTPNNQSSSSSSSKSQSNEAAMIKDIRIANEQNKVFLHCLNDILSSLSSIKSQFTSLESTKQAVVGTIDTFYKESSRIIDEQKNLLDLQQEVKTNLQYYLAVEEISNSLDTIQKDMLSRSLYESQLQRFLSEIIDGILFFESHPTFLNATQMLAAYRALKLRTTSFIKNFFFKIFNKEFTFINTQLTKNIFKNALPILKTYQNAIHFTRNPFQSTLSNPKPTFLRCLMNVGLYPQLKRGYGIDEFKDQLLESGIKDLHLFELTPNVRYLISFIECNSVSDSDLDDLYANVFLKYMTYCRLNFHKEMCEHFTSTFSSLSFATTPAAASSSSTPASPTSAPSPTNMNSNPLRKQDALNCAAHFAFQQLLSEFIYTVYVFNFSNVNTAESVRARWQQLIDVYLTFMRPTVAWDNNSLDQQLENIDVLSAFVDHYDEMIEAATAEHTSLASMLAQIQSNEQKKNLLSVFKEMLRGFFEKVRNEIMLRLLSSSSVHVQEKIISFDANAFCRSNSMVIHRFKKDDPSKSPASTPTSSSSAIASAAASTPTPLQRDNVLPVVISAQKILSSLKGRLEKNSLQKIVYDIVSACLGHIYIIAEKYEEKFDAMLFVIKNTLLLNACVQELGVDFTIKETEIDFSEMRTFISDIQHGKLSHLYTTDSMKPENLWTTTTSFFKILYKGLPKLQEFTVDLKKNLVKQLSQAEESLNKDMTFIISKSLIDFIKRYHSFKNCLAEINAQKQQREQTIHSGMNEEQKKQHLQQLQQQQQHLPFTEQDVLNDMKSLLDPEVVTRCYHIFNQNFTEFIDEMLAKMNNFLDESLFNTLAKNIQEIIDNSAQLFSQFSIILSKHLPDQQYDTLNLPDPSTLKQQALAQIVFIRI